MATMEDVSGMRDEMRIDSTNPDSNASEATREATAEPSQPTVSAIAITQLIVQPVAITAMQVLTINYRQEEFGTLEKMAALR